MWILHTHVVCLSAMLRYSLSSDPPVRPTRLRFGLLSAEEIRRMAVVEVTETTLYYRGLPASGGLLDPLMGSVDRRHLCASCMCDARTCQGHPGFISLSYPVYHIGFVDTLLKTLRTVCFSCSRILFTDEERQAVEGVGCSPTRLQQIHATLRNRKHCPHCGMPHPHYSRTPFGIHVEWGEAAFESKEEEEFCKRPFTAREALSILKSMTNEDVELLGFHRETSHPSCMVLQNILVPPPCTRPAIYSSEGSRSRGQNDLTVRLMEILKRSHDIKNTLGDTPWWEADPSPELLEKLARLQYEVFIFVNNSSRIQRPPGMGRTTGGQNSKSITDRLRGKEGRVRGNLMGKRVDFSSRCVITPDAYFDCDRVGVPYSIARNLTIPETVNTTNIRSLSQRVRVGSKDVHGAQNIIRVDGTVINLTNCTERDDIVLRPGDIVERFLADDDVVVFNRQPSLHLHGMQAHRVTLMPGHTFRISLVVAAPYNADFDGDEMNLHVPQSKAASAECATLMAVGQNVIGDQANKPVMGIVQDTLLGLHVLSGQDVLLDHAHACRMLGQTRFCDKRLPAPSVIFWEKKGRKKKTSLWTGKQMFSALLPKDLYVEHALPEKTTAEEWNDDDLPVIVLRGQLLCGVLRKAHVGTAAGGITDVMCREYGGVALLRFMADNQRMIHAFLLQKGHHVGIDDVMLSRKGHDRVSERLDKASRLCEEIQKEILDAPQETRVLGEKAILRMLGKMLLQTGGIVEEEMSKKNAIRRMVKGGSKGSFINLSQICACLGQQSLEGSRIIAGKGTRTLPCFAQDDYSLASRGMVYNSFALGLSPPELFYHAIGGREGLVDTAVKTSQTGYIQRRMNKSMEDHTVHSDGTIRNSLKYVISFMWGSDGLHPGRVERVKFPLLSSSLHDLRRRFTDKELQLVMELRHAILRVKTNVLCAELDDRVLLPFNPQRLKRSMRREPAASTHSHSAASVPWYERLFPHTSSTVVRLALIDLLCKANTAHLSDDTLERYVSRLRNTILNAHNIVGESVGCLAAQSVGEPATQMTLNTFHTAGVAAKNVTLGLPRLKELLDASKNSKTPCTTLRLQPHLSKTPFFGEYLANTLTLTRLGDIVHQCSVLFDPDCTTPAIESDRYMVLSDALLNGMETGSDFGGHTSYVVRFQLQREMMNARRLTPPMIRRILQERLDGRANVISSETNALEWIVRVRFAHVKEMIEHGGLTRDHEAILCHQAMNVLLETVVVSGHPNVTAADCMEQTRHFVDEDGNLKSEVEHVVNVYGNFLTDCASSECIDWKRCTSNEIWNVYHTLGIEACVHVFFDQLKSVVSFDGTYVADQHLIMIADTVCRGGTIMPLNRHGINKTDVSPLMRCSFEETTDVLCNAALHAEEENARGVTSSIMMGQLAKFGTGGVQVLFPWNSVSQGLCQTSNARVLRSTCRSYKSVPNQETVEYVTDDIKPGAHRSLSPSMREVRDDVAPRSRARFRHVSPER